MARNKQTVDPFDSLLDDVLGDGSNAQTPMENWVLASLPDGSQYWYDPASNTRVAIGRDSYRQMNGQLVAIDPAGKAHVVPVEGLQPAQPSATALSAQKRLDMAGKYDVPPGGGGIPTGYWDNAGVHHDFTAAEAARYAPAAIRQRKAEIQAELRQLEDSHSPQLIASLENDTTSWLGRTVNQLRTEMASLNRTAGSIEAGGGIGGGGSTGSSRVEFPSERALREAQTERERATAATEPFQQDYYKAQAEKIRQDVLKTQREMLPPNGLALENYRKSVLQLSDMIESGDISQADADAYMEAFKANLQSTLRGTTPFQEQQHKDQETRQRADIGKDLLNQRLTSGTSVANTLLSGFSQNLDTLGAGLKPGQVVPFDPFALSQQFTSDLQGGPQVSETAKALLAAIAPRGQGPAAAVPTAGGGLPPDLLEQLRRLDAQQGAGGVQLPAPSQAQTAVVGATP